MAYRNDKLRDLTPSITSFIPGESPSAEKLQGMMRQADAAIEYLENKIGDLAGEEKSFTTWVTTLARNIGDFSRISPLVLPNHEELDYEQELSVGKMEHELDLVPVGDLSDLLESSTDDSIVSGQWKSSVSLLKSPGDWTIESSYIENGEKKRGRKLVTHSPSSGGTVSFKKATSGRGSSLESSSENTIPSIAQAEDGGPFAEFELVDPTTKQYLVTLPIRSAMYDKLGQTIAFSASNSKAGVGYNSQYKLPSFFFNISGLDLLSSDENGDPKEIPLNLITLYDWETKKEIEGIISLKAGPTASTREYQFILQTKSDVILDIANGKYIFAVAGNSISDQIKAISDAVFNNTGDGNEMMRLLLHKNTLNLRTGSTNYSNRSAYYGPSSIDNNDHSMYFHRNGYTPEDTGAGGNVVRGHVVVGSTTTGTSDSVHENFNVSSDSNFLYFGNIEKGPSLKYVKALPHAISHSYGGLPVGIVDCGLLITGAASDLNSLRKNVFIEGDIRTSGNVILGQLDSDVIFMQGKVYINDELTLIPRTTSGITAEEGKILYSSTQKALVVYNGSSWSSPWDYTGYNTVIGDGVTSFGKYNSQSHLAFQNALTDVPSGGTIKVLPGNYNFLGNKITIPANVLIEGSGEKTIVLGTGTVFESSGSGSGVKNLTIKNASIGIKPDSSLFTIGSVRFVDCAIAIQPTSLATNLKILENITYSNCPKTIDYANIYKDSILIPSSQTVVKSALTYSDKTVNDWGLKEEVFRDFTVNSGNAVLTYDPTSESAIGAGSFKIMGTGNIVNRKYLPVNPNVGIGGHINIKRLGVGGTVSVGVVCYNASLGMIGVKYFILDNFGLDSTLLENCFYKGMMIGFSGYTGAMFPSGTKFVQPIISITANGTSGILFDSFEIDNMTYARVGTWS
jgi:hypothetical protein